MKGQYWLRNAAKCCTKGLNALKVSDEYNLKKKIIIQGAKQASKAVLLQPLGTTRMLFYLTQEDFYPQIQSDSAEF